MTKSSIRPSSTRKPILTGLYLIEKEVVAIEQESRYKPVELVAKHGLPLVLMVYNLDQEIILRGSCGRRIAMPLRGPILVELQDNGRWIDSICPPTTPASRPPARAPWPACWKRTKGVRHPLVARGITLIAAFRGVFLVLCRSTEECPLSLRGDSDPYPFILFFFLPGRLRNR